LTGHARGSRIVAGFPAFFSGVTGLFMAITGQSFLMLKVDFVSVCPAIVTVKP
jgi:hypothetical protein